MRSRSHSVGKTLSPLEDFFSNPIQLLVFPSRSHCTMRYVKTRTQFLEEQNFCKNLTLLLPRHFHSWVWLFNLRGQFLARKDFEGESCLLMKVTLLILMSMSRSAISKRRPWDTEDGRGHFFYHMLCATNKMSFFSKTLKSYTVTELS